MKAALRRALTKATALLIATCLLGCSLRADERRDRFDFDLDAAGKADGQAVLAPDDLARVADAFDRAIGAAETEIARLETEIRKLEEGNRRKQTEIDQLVGRISTRRAEVERNRNLALVAAGAFGIFTFGLGAIAGAAAVGSLAVALANDSRLQQLQRELAQARSEQQAMQSQATRYQTQKSALATQLAAVRSGKAKLVAALESPDPIAPTESLRAYAEAAAGFRRVKLLEGILALTNEEIDALTKIRDLAQALSDALDHALATLRALAADADRLAKESRNEFLKILEAALSGDPLAVATAWLSDVVAAKTREVLNELGFPAADFVAHLVRTRFIGSAEEIASLTEHLIAKLAGAAVESTTEWHWSGSDRRSQPIEDLGWVDSTLNVDRSGEVTRGRVSVEIRHSFPGDLYIWLVHGDKGQVLHEYEGGARPDVVKTYDLTELVGSDASGAWELVIADDEADHDGTLVSWTLELEGAL